MSWRSGGRRDDKEEGGRECRKGGREGEGGRLYWSECVS